jgi:hypothetical protein
MKLRITIYILILFAFLTSCNSKSEKSEKGMPKDAVKVVERQELKESTQKMEWIDSSIDCNFVYDTIKNKKYNMHLGILEKFNNKEKRGYFFSAEGDTLNIFLYHQDIAAFMLGLDSQESGIYKALTNKVVFLILENEPKMLDYGLTQWTRKEEQLDYFMKHVSNPTCNTMPVDGIIEIIQRDMGEPHEGAKKVKLMLIEQLKKSKK